MFKKRNLISARSCESLLFFLTFSIPSVPLFRKGLVHPHNTDTSTRLSSSTENTCHRLFTSVLTDRNYPRVLWGCQHVEVSFRFVIPPHFKAIRNFYDRSRSTSTTRRPLKHRLNYVLVSKEYIKWIICSVKHFLYSWKCKMHILFL